MVLIGHTKARKQRAAVVVTIGSKFKVPEGQEFYIIKEEDGSFRLIPKDEDFFETMNILDDVKQLEEFNATYTPKWGGEDE